MVIDCTGIRPAPSKMEAIGKIPRPLGMTGYLRQFVPNYRLVATPLTDLLRINEYASKRARKMNSLGSRRRARFSVIAVVPGIPRGTRVPRSREHFRAPHQRQCSQRRGNSHATHRRRVPRNFFREPSVLSHYFTEKSHGKIVHGCLVGCRSIQALPLGQAF